MTAPPVSAEMAASIRDRLDQIASEEGARVLLAVESGSRAWGFHSPDSDYDVRFVYARPVEWHLRLTKRRDVIERPISDELDISGWELGKALSLAMKSNAVIAEWLQSPLIYAADDQAVRDLTAFCRRVLNRRAVSWHYLSMAEQQMRRLRGADGQIRLKRYFYTLRPVLALRHMRLHGSAMVPMNMAQLMAATDLTPAVTGYLDDLIAQKRGLAEAAPLTRTDPACDALIADEIAAARDWLQMQPADSVLHDWDSANALNLKWSTRA